MDGYYRSEEQELHHNSLPPSSSPISLSPSTAEDVEEERKYMFEKVVTPSDVGKLNRLVIPKQYAERYFPLDRASSNVEEPGRLLSFEEVDRGAGRRTWRFRYSYWNSSQSYVMTKGWSRFVKDKRLGAGDTVTFSQGAASSPGCRLFIDWRHRQPPPDPPRLLRSSVPWGWGAGRLFVPPPPPPPSPAIASASTNSKSAMYYYRSAVRPVPPLLRMGGRILDSVPLCVAAEPKRVRLFGVNLDCTEQEEEDDYRRRQQRESTNHLLPPPSPLQWRLSPTPAPASRSELPQLPLPAMDQEGARK